MKFTPAGGRVQINVTCEMQNHENRNKIISKVGVLLSQCVVLGRSNTTVSPMCLYSSAWKQWDSFAWRSWILEWVSLPKTRRESSASSRSSRIVNSAEAVIMCLT